MSFMLLYKHGKLSFFGGKTEEYKNINIPTNTQDLKEEAIRKKELISRMPTEYFGLCCLFFSYMCAAKQIPFS